MQIKVNSDKELVKEIREAIKANDGHCCCAIEFTDDNLCICKDFKDQMERGEPGTCHCGLYTILVDD